MSPCVTVVQKRRKERIENTELEMTPANAESVNAQMLENQECESQCQPITRRLASA